MADPVELLGTTLAGVTVGGLAMKVLEAFGKRSINALDDTLKALKVSIDELGRDIRALRETDIAQAKDIGALQESHRSIEKRVDGQGTHYREQLEEHRRLVHDRMAEATRAMLEAVQSFSKRRKS